MAILHRDLCLCLMLKFESTLFLDKPIIMSPMAKLFLENERPPSLQLSAVGSNECTVNPDIYIYTPNPVLPVTVLVDAFCHNVLLV